MKYFLGLLLLTACAAPRPIQKFPRIKEVNPHVELFEEICDIKVNIPIYYGELPYPKAGVCRSIGSYQEIILDISSWVVYSYLRRELVIFHELGHCTLGLGHNDKLLSDNCPSSLMNTELVPSNCYERHREYYIEELCTKN
jgi:hypothetical protein